MADTPAAAEFFDHASDPRFSDEMSFKITASHDDPEMMFSMEAIQATFANVARFFLARMLAAYEARGKRAAKAVNIRVRLDWFDTPDEAEWNPYWRLADPHDAMLVDTLLNEGEVERVVGQMVEHALPEGESK